MANVRTVVFRLSAVALLVFMAVVPFSLLGVIAPWFLLRAGNAPGFTAEIHRWHGAQFGALWGIVLGGALVALQFKPASKAGLVQFLVAAEALFVLAAVIFPSPDNFQPVFFYGSLIFLILLVATYADRGALLRFRSQVQPDPLPLALTAVVTAPLIYDIYRNLNWQIAGIGGEHLTWGHWSNALVADLVLVVAGVLISFHVAGWRVLSCLTGIALILLGAAGIATAAQVGSWGLVGGSFAVFCGLGYVALAVRDRLRRLRPGAA